VAVDGVTGAARAAEPGEVKRVGSDPVILPLAAEGTRLAIERGGEGFARWRLQEGRGRLSPAQQRAFDSRLHAVA
jgi:hypothetical protein